MKKKIVDVDYKIPGISGLATTTVLNTKTDEVENKIPVTGLATTSLLNTKIDEVDDKISDVNKLVKEVYYNAKVTDIEGKYFTTAEYNKFASDILETNVGQWILYLQSHKKFLLKHKTYNFSNRSIIKSRVI